MFELCVVKCVGNDLTLVMGTSQILDLWHRHNHDLFDYA